MNDIIENDESYSYLKSYEEGQVDRGDELKRLINILKKERPQFQHYYEENKQVLLTLSNTNNNSERVSLKLGHNERDRKTCKEYRILPLNNLGLDAAEANMDS